MTWNPLLQQPFVRNLCSSGKRRKVWVSIRSDRIQLQFHSRMCFPAGESVYLVCTCYCYGGGLDWLTTSSKSCWWQTLSTGKWKWFLVTVSPVSIWVSFNGRVREFSIAYFFINGFFFQCWLFTSTFVPFGVTIMHRSFYFFLFFCAFSHSYLNLRGPSKHVCNL